MPQGTRGALPCSAATLPADQPMPAYREFPPGTTPFVTAVMMMIFTIAILVPDMILELEPAMSALLPWGLTMLLGLILSTASIMVTRGITAADRFLLQLNTACLLACVLFLPLSLYSRGLAGSWPGYTALAFALIARRCYQAPAYREGVEYFRLIWAHHRYRKWQARSFAKSQKSA